MSEEPLRESPRVVAGYRLQRPLGRGGMGTVWLAESPAGAPCALKLVDLRVDPEGTRRTRFLREAAALAKVDRHPGVVRIHTSGLTPEGVGYMALDYVSGGDLAQSLEQGPLPIPMVLQLGARLARALAHVHAAGLVHRDLKPGNVLIRQDDGAPLLTDFGVARDAAEERMTRTGATVGTPHYMAPEQLTGEQVGPAADVFSLGVVLYQMLTGVLPFQGEHPMDLVAAVIRSDPDRPRRMRPEIPPDLEDVLFAALRKAPGERPTAQRVAEDLEAIAAGRSTRSRAGLALRARRGEPRALGALAGGLVAILGLAVLAGEVLVLGPRREDAALLAEHARWEEEVLLRTGLGASATPLPPEEVAARRRRLEELRSRRGDLPGLGRHLELLAAEERLGTGERPPLTPRARGSAQLAVDARLFLSRGELELADRRLELALGQEPEFLPARLLAQEVAAARDPRGFLEGLSGLQGAVLERARSLAPEALRAAYLAAVEGAPGRPAELAGLARLAEAQRLSLEPLREDKARLLEEAAPRWRAALLDAVRAGRELEVLARLAALAGAPPRVGPGPALSAVLAATSAAISAEYRRDAPLTERLRAIRFELDWAEHLDLAHPPGRGALDAINDLAVMGRPKAGDVEAAGVLLRGAMLWEPTIPTGDAARSTGLTPDELRRLLAERPTSQAMRVALALRLNYFGLEEAVELLRSLDEPNLLHDLHPAHEGEARVDLSSYLLAGPGRTPALLQEARREARRARELRPHSLWLVQESYANEVTCFLLLRQPQEALECADQALRALEPLARALTGAGGGAIEPDPDIGRAGRDPIRALAETRGQRARALAALGRLEEAAREMQEAIEQATRVDDSGVNFMQLTLAEFEARLGRREQALARVKAVLPRMGGDPFQSELAVSALLACDRRDLAEEVCRALKARFPQLEHAVVRRVIQAVLPE